MSFFKNKHVITAMIVAPILAVLTYYVVDSFVKEQPAPSVAGGAYPLVAKSNCRFTSGECRLENASFHSTLTVRSQGDEKILELRSSHALQQANIGFVRENGDELTPSLMSSVGESGTHWQLALPVEPTQDSLARLALQANNAFYFAETSLGFTRYETIFRKDLHK